MKLKSHRIEGVPFTRARDIGQIITPELVILHDTASRLSEGSAAGYLLGNPAKTSVHFVVERSGAVVQQVPTNRRANHAGQSHYHGRDLCNGFSIGIEIVNPGRMTRAGSGKAAAWYKQVFDIAEYGIQEVSTPEHGTGLWMDYTEAQIDSVIWLCEALFAGIPSLKDIRTHWYVSPGRKTDTNPLFPLEAVRSRVMGRDDPADAAAEAGSTDVKWTRMVRITAASGLNMRRWPSFNPNVIATIPDGTEVPISRSGTFAGRTWHRVFYAGQHNGWIVETYTQPVQ